MPQLDNLKKNNQEKKMFSPTKVVRNELEDKDGIWFGPKGLYWSNLDQDKNESYVQDLAQLGSKQTMKKYFPQHETVIFSPQRAGGIATLDIQPTDVILDAGCMWGALTMPLARTGAQVIGADQTQASLQFLKKRRDEEELHNLSLVCGDLKQLKFEEQSLDKIVVNGVLEWIPEIENVEVSKFVKKRNSIFRNVKKLFQKKESLPRPDDIQVQFLSNLQPALKDDGTLYLAIENRFDLMYFIGMPEPHCGLRFFSFLPHWLQDTVSVLLRGRVFRNWTYSPGGIKKILERAGFTNIELFYAFPDYRLPELVLTKPGMKYFRNCSPIGKNARWKRIIARIAEEIVFKRLKMTFFASSLIIHAKKL